MSNKRATVCKLCGAPRWEKAKTALCLEHWSEYRRDIYRQNYDKAHPEARRYCETASRNIDRVCSPNRAYARLNIRARVDMVKRAEG